MRHQYAPQKNVLLLWDSTCGKVRWITILTPTLYWHDDALVIVDQAALPTEKILKHLTSAQAVYAAIRDMHVRGAPAIGIAAAFGLYLGVRNSAATDIEVFRKEAADVADFLNSARPTAINLAWALERMMQQISKPTSATVGELKSTLLSGAQRLIDEDNAICLAIGRHGRPLLRNGMGILTHCNAGGLGTAQFGTALAPIYVAAREGLDLEVYVDETRPVLQGARLTAWELNEAGVPVTLICDNMAAVVMERGWAQAVIVGTDRVARNGDVANKIGTYGLAVLAKAHGIPFYVAAPRSSIDMNVASGKEIPIEERDPKEITEGLGRVIAPAGISVFNPAFDVTPADLVTAIITEVGIVKPPYALELQRIMDLPALALDPEAPQLR